MKKIIVLLAMVLSVACMSAQDKILYYSNGNVIYTRTIENVDSVSFSSTGTSTSYTNLNESSFNFPVMGIDSIVFYVTSQGGDDPSEGEDEGDIIYITYNNGGTVGVINPWSSRGIAVTCNGEDVVVNAASGTQDRTIFVSGTTIDGSLVINTDYRFNLILGGADITNPTGAAINVPSDKKVTLKLKDGTTNTLSDGSTSADKAALQCKGAVDIYDNGTLNIAGKSKHAINSDAHIYMYAGTINITEAANDGLHANNFKLYGGNMTIRDFNGDGIQAQYGATNNNRDGNIEILGGSLDIMASVADTKGMKCDTIIISGGNLLLIASGNQTKAIKAGTAFIAGGSTEITASGATVVEAGDPSYCTGIKATNTYITNGTLTITCPVSNDGARGISCDNTVAISGGTTTISVAGNGGTYTNASNVSDTYSATCIKADVAVIISAGTVDLTASGTNSRAISCDGDVTISDDADITMTLSGNASKGFKCDQTITIDGGSIDITASGATVVTNSDPSYCLGIKGATVIINGGTITVNGTSTNNGCRGISSDGDLTINGGTMNFSMLGSGTTITTSDGYAPVCVKADGNANIYGGNISCTCSGKGGRGMKIDGALVIGRENADDSLINIEITSSGTSVNGSSGGGGFPGGGSSSGYTGNPKGIKCMGNVTINSGRVAVYANHEGIESKNQIVINGGIVEVNAGDDCLNASNYLEIAGGKVWVYARGSDALDNNGTNTVFSGGLIIVGGSNHEQALDCDLGENSSHKLTISGATIVAFGGNMGVWAMNSSSTPTMQNNQKYLLTASSGGGFPGGGSSSSSYSITNTIVIKDASGNVVLAYQGPSSISGNGWDNGGGIRPPGGGGSNGGFAFSSTELSSGTYSLYKTATISGGTSWHGFYTSATVTTSGTATSITAKP